ncbi:MAG: hypothetical protein WCG95_03100 [bacterium]
MVLNHSPLVLVQTHVLVPAPIQCLHLVIRAPFLHHAPQDIYNLRHVGALAHAKLQIATLVVIIPAVTTAAVVAVAKNAAGGSSGRIRIVALNAVINKIT